MSYLMAVLRRMFLSGVLLLGSFSVASAQTERPAEQSSPLVISADSQEKEITLAVNFAALLRFENPIVTVVLGDPSIAEATLVDDQVVVVTGKSDGITNLILLDDNGTASTIVLRIEQHSVENGSRVTVFSGLASQSYVCAIRCLPSP